jgi:hypothetical protein
MESMRELFKIYLDLDGLTVLCLLYSKGMHVNSSTTACNFIVLQYFIYLEQ